MWVSFPRTSETWEQFPSLKTNAVIVFRKKAPQPPSAHFPWKKEEEEKITDSSTMYARSQDDTLTVGLTFIVDLTLEMKWRILSVSLCPPSPRKCCLRHMYTVVINILSWTYMYLWYLLSYNMKHSSTIMNDAVYMTAY